MVGLRLGANLAAMAAEKRHDISAMVLWEPVVSGKTFVEELLYLSKSSPYKTSCQSGNGRHDVLGCPLTSDMMRDLEQVDLLNSWKTTADQVLVIGSELGQDGGNLNRYIDQMGETVTYRLISDSRIWLNKPHEAIVPRQTLQAIVAWISGVSS
jgi:hypothetical protein